MINLFWIFIKQNPFVFTIAILYLGAVAVTLYNDWGKWPFAILYGCWAIGNLAIIFAEMLVKMEG